MRDQELQREAERHAEYQREQEAYEQARYDDELSKAEQCIRELEEEVVRLKDAIREHRDSFSKDMDEHDWTTEDEALWALVEEAAQ